MTIQGNLGTIGQGSDNLLRQIHRERLTGRLSIFYENEQRRNVQDVIFIEQGMIIGLKSLDKYGVKELLVYANKLTREQVEAASVKATQSGDGKTAEQVLLEEGTITREVVIQAIATLIRGCIQRILTKPYGLYIFHPSDQLKGVKAMTRIGSMQTILDYCRALKKPEVFGSLITSQDLVPSLAVNIEEIRKRYHLTDEEWRLLMLVSGERSVADILAAAGIAADHGQKLLYTLAMADFIRLGAGAHEPAPHPQGMPGMISPMASAQQPPPSPSGAPRMPPPMHITASSPAGNTPSGVETGISTGAMPSRQEHGDTHAAPPPPPKEFKGTILVVDDSKTIQKMVEIALKDLPYKLVMADDGFMAIELAQQVHPNLVILDVIMPKLDGYKTCGQLKKVFAPRKVPVIMLTARDGTFDKIKGRLAGASMYMAKPFEGEELQAAVTKFLSEGH